jgi:hypothetical protein
MTRMTIEIVTDGARMPYAMPRAVEHPENQKMDLGVIVMVISVLLERAQRS